MSSFASFMGHLLAVFGSMAFLVAIVVWLSILPTIGLLWTIGLVR